MRRLGGHGRRTREDRRAGLRQRDRKARSKRDQNRSCALVRHRPTSLLPGSCSEYSERAAKPCPIPLGDSGHVGIPGVPHGANPWRLTSLARAAAGTLPRRPRTTAIFKMSEVPPDRPDSARALCPAAEAARMAPECRPVAGVSGHTRGDILGRHSGAARGPKMCRLRSPDGVPSGYGIRVLYRPSWARRGGLGLPSRECRSGRWSPAARSDLLEVARALASLGARPVGTLVARGWP